jgi:hypothetical protein
MTGSYFRGDAEAILDPADESKFETVTYTYYEQLNGYRHFTLDEHPMARVFWADLVAREEVEVVHQDGLEFLVLILTMDCLHRLSLALLSRHVNVRHFSPCLVAKLPFQECG